MTREPGQSSLLHKIALALPEAVVVTAGESVIYANSEFAHLFGYSPEEVLGRALSELLVPEDRKQEAAMLLEMARHRGRVAIETVRLDRSRNPIDVSLVLAVFEQEGFDLGFIASFRDIRARRQSESKLQHYALHDVLTGLPNRALYLDRLNLAMARRLRRKDLSCAVMFVDLDHFKEINDTLGHAAGDALLMEVANRLRAALRPHDTAARLSGDEFALLLDNLRSIEDLEVIAGRILASFRREFVLEGKKVNVGASIGVAMCTDDHQLPEQLLRDADFAMYQAKRQGGLQCEIFDSRMQVRLTLRNERETEMRELLDRRDFTLWYQPYYRLQSCTLEGFESLLRWRRQNGTFEPLRDILDMADRSGFAMHLNRETLLNGCRQLQEWSRKDKGPNFTLSMNVSARQLYHPEMIGLVSSVLESTTVDPHRVIIEISESALNENPDSALRIVERLAEREVRIAVDNFGSRLAPLGQLFRFPIDLIKLDRELVAPVASSARHCAALRALTELCHSLGHKVCAQGVENVAQLDALREVGCDQVQGYLFAPAVESAAAADLLTQRVWSGPEA